MFFNVKNYFQSLKILRKCNPLKPLFYKKLNYESNASLIEWAYRQMHCLHILIHLKSHCREKRVENRMLTLNWKWMRNWNMSEFIWKWPDWAFCHYGQQQFKREIKFNCKDTHIFSFCPSEYVAGEIHSY